VSSVLRPLQHSHVKRPNKQYQSTEGGSRHSNHGSRMEAPKVPTGVECGEGYHIPSPVGMGSPSKWCILMHSEARFRPTIATMMFMYQTSTVSFQIIFEDNGQLGQLIVTVLQQHSSKLHNHVQRFRKKVDPEIFV